MQLVKTFIYIVRMFPKSECEACTEPNALRGMGILGWNAWDNKWSCQD